MTNRSSPIENSSIAIFRSFVGIIVILTVLSLVSMLSIFNDFSRISNQLASLFFYTCLFVYLSFRQLQTLLGRWYLPIALIIATVVPLASQRLFQDQVLKNWLASGAQSALSNRDLILSLGDSWVIVLFLPLVLIAWQYRFRTVSLFVLGTFVLDAMLTIQVFRQERDYLIIMFNTIISRSIAFIVVGFIVTKLVERQHQQQHELTTANKQLTNYANVLEKFSVNVEQLATSRERNRLARELHDTLAHTLSALSVQLEATDTLWSNSPDQARDLLQNALVTTRSGLMETRRALHALRASPLEDLGLALAVRSLAELAAQRENFELEVDISPILANLSPQTEQTIYRVVQESLENICRHANSQHVSLALKREGSLITTVIEDNGSGFNLLDIDQEKKLGLRGMRERVEMLGGTLDVQSAVGKGTTIRLTMNEAA